MNRLIIIFVSICISCFIGCTKDEIAPFDGTSHVIQDVQPEEWQFDGEQYYLALDFPEITESIFQDGHVSVAISYNQDTDGDYYHNIPAVIGDHNFNVKYGFESLIVTADFIPSGGGAPPEALYMKIIITRSEIGLTL